MRPPEHGMHGGWCGWEHVAGSDGDECFLAAVELAYSPAG